MNGLWPQLEPLLAKVAKPARYIGLEEGAQRPDHSPDRVAWLLAYPDTYEIGLPNQGLQILYEILNERPDAAAERTYAPWVDLEELLRARGLPLFSLDTHRPASDFDVLAFNLSAELTYTNLLNMVDLAGVPVRAADRRARATRWWAPAGHCTYNPEPLADFLDFVVLGDGEEAVGGDHRGAGRVEGVGPHRRQPGARAARAVPHPGRLRALDVRGHLRRAPTSSRSRPATPTCPSSRREAHRRRPGRLALPQATSWSPSPRWSTTGSTSRCSGAAPGAAASARRG